MAYIGAKIVMDLARVLQNPIVEPENTFGKKSRCPIYRLPKLPVVPKFVIERKTGTTYF